ncbi:DUF5753 domain-containing protein [Actinomadura hibisca]|uniref:DUF5753 domain-containing protein n=1 Tax=Actinomadura hibisca TaxID=68565 RepID=UPI00083748CB|nr:DUF5753 domain-containing protein [Actinomadura hibisca]
MRSRGYPRYFADFSEAESSAVMLRNYENRIVYGLLQARVYAEVILSNPRAVEERLRRQEILTRSNAPTLFAVLDESILYREVGGPEVMRAQLEWLQEVAGWPHVTLQIALMIFHRGARAPFTIATQPDRSEVVYLENAARGEASAEATDLSAVTETFARLQANSLSASASVSRIGKVVSERWT